MSAMLKQKLIDIANGFTKYGLWKGGGSSNLSELDDVTLTNLQTNDVLSYNGSKWVNDDNLQKQINTLNSNLGDIGNISILMQSGYATGNNVDILDLSQYRMITFIAIWDGAQFLNMYTIPYSLFMSFTGGVMVLKVLNEHAIEIRPVDNTHINLKCSSTYLSLRVYGIK